MKGEQPNLVVKWTDALQALLDDALIALARNNPEFDAEDDTSRGRYAYTSRWAIRLLHDAMKRREAIDWESYGKPWKAHREQVLAGKKSVNHYALWLRTSGKGQLIELVYMIERDAMAFSALRAREKYGRGIKLPMLSVLMAALEYAIRVSNKEGVKQP